MAEAIKTTSFLNNRRKALHWAPKNGANPAQLVGDPGATIVLTPMAGGAPDIVTVDMGMTLDATGAMVPDPMSAVFTAVPGKLGTQLGNLTDGHISAPLQVSLQDSLPATMNLTWDPLDYPV